MDAFSTGGLVEPDDVFIVLAVVEAHLLKSEPAVLHGLLHIVLI
jgi:hypothetical protein